MGPHQTLQSSIQVLDLFQSPVTSEPMSPLAKLPHQMMRTGSTSCFHRFNEDPVPIKLLVGEAGHGACHFGVAFERRERCYGFSQCGRWRGRWRDFKREVATCLGCSLRAPSQKQSGGQVLTAHGWCTLMSDPAWWDTARPSN